MSKRQTQAIHDRIVEYVKNHPDDIYADISHDLNIPRSTLVYVLSKAGYRRNDSSLNTINLSALACGIVPMEN